MKTILILNAQVVNEGSIERKDIFIKDGIIQKIDKDLFGLQAGHIINGHYLYLFPGVIDDQVHFRDWNQADKATVSTESRAAVIGGITSFIEQPNTDPQIITLDLLEQRNAHDRQNSLCNFGVNFGATLYNYDEVMRLDLKNNPGVKVFWGSSTGGMLVNDPELIAKMGSNSPAIFIFHSEDESRIKTNFERFKKMVDEEQLPLGTYLHPIIRDVMSCVLSTETIVNIAEATGMRTHLYHITTAEELVHFSNGIDLCDKKITSEVCVHHLHFTKDDYEKYQNLIKCNPSIKAPHHKKALWSALLKDKIDVVATDHAPHTLEQKMQNYWDAPAGVPLIQYSLNLMLEYYHQGVISLEKIVEKMCHNPAICFRIKNRGFIREGCHADLVLVDLNGETLVDKSRIAYKCKWSPFEGQTFKSHIAYTIVGGIIKQIDGKIVDKTPGMQMEYTTA